jgi:hypothetical protein
MHFAGCIADTCQKRLPALLNGQRNVHKLEVGRMIGQQIIDVKIVVEQQIHSLSIVDIK